MKELELTHQELKYLIIRIEGDLENHKGFMDMDSNEFMDMLHQLYSKLIIRENEKLTHKEY
jgi:hypothetical protein